MVSNDSEAYVVLPTARVCGSFWTHLVDNRTAHARNEDDASAVPETRHLSAGCLRSEQHAVHVHVYDLCISSQVNKGEQPQQRRRHVRMRVCVVGEL